MCNEYMHCPFIKEFIFLVQCVDKISINESINKLMLKMSIMVDDPMLKMFILLLLHPYKLLSKLTVCGLTV